MEPILSEEGATPSPLALAAVSVAVSGVAFVALLLLAPWATEWLWSGFALPSAAVGSLVAHRTGRWWPFCLGLGITLLPLLLFVVLPGPPPIGGAGGD
jgi:hypothetical protein